MSVQIITTKTSEKPGGGDLVFEYAGLSADSKPAVGVGDGSAFWELDTHKIWVYSTSNVNPATSDGWWEV